MRIEANRKQGYQLLHHGSIELAHIESNGIRIDVPRLKKTQLKLQKKVAELRESLELDDVWALWRRRFGQKAKLSSRDQLGKILFEELKYDVAVWTDTGKPATDEEALQKVDHPFVKSYLRMMKYEKARGTFLAGIEREVVGDRLHPVFNLHIARTYRSSSDSPNFQNFPVRDKEISKIIRTLFIPSPDSVLVENDFKGIEVSVSASYHKDKNFISYITTPGKDMHRDMAAQIYMLDPKDVSKDARYGAKNKFVFPQFYGDYYITCAKALWDWIEKGKLITPGGAGLFDHLAERGIHSRGACDPEQKPVPGTFEDHLKAVEDDFWNNRFMDYGKWRKKWYQDYLDRGYFDLLTGFRIHGSFSRNSVTNYPIQGSAFHCLLWSLIKVNRKLRKYNFKSKAVGQIHDSLIGDVKIKELSSYLEIVEETITVDLLKEFKWIKVPLEIEYEIAPSTGTWFDKKEVKFSKGVFTHPTNPKLNTKKSELFIRALDNMDNV
jgi:DNA polymerase I